jgi:putative nucleotidyltransferase with HDIG domain
MAWLAWIFIPSLVLLAAVAIRASLRDPRKEGPLGAYPGAPVSLWFSTDRETRRYHQERFEQMKKLLGLPSSFGFLVEPDGPCPRGHAQAVSWLAIQIAREVGLSGQEIEEIRIAGFLHDIGKLHVPWHVLNKPVLLTPEEYEVMKSHAACGEEMLKPFGMKNVGRIVRHHHERYDGKGYPDGLGGEKIPLGARIVAAAECFADMVSEQDYRSARTFKDAVVELRNCSAAQFDHSVVTTFVDWLEIHGDPRAQRLQQEYNRCR